MSNDADTYLHLYKILTSISLRITRTYSRRIYNIYILYTIRVRDTKYTCRAMIIRLYSAAMRYIIWRVLLKFRRKSPMTDFHVGTRYNILRLLYANNILYVSKIAECPAACVSTKLVLWTPVRILLNNIMVLQNGVQKTMYTGTAGTNAHCTGWKCKRGIWILLLWRRRRMWTKNKTVKWPFSRVRAA